MKSTTQTIKEWSATPPLGNDPQKLVMKNVPMKPGLIHVIKSLK